MFHSPTNQAYFEKVQHLKEGCRVKIFFFAEVIKEVAKIYFGEKTFGVSGCLTKNLAVCHCPYQELRKVENLDLKNNY